VAVGSKVNTATKGVDIRRASRNASNIGRHSLGGEVYKTDAQA
jgi:hypothetical protein